MSHTQQISAFWKWFATHAERIRDAYSEQNFDWLSKQIAPHVKRIEERLKDHLEMV